MSRIKQDNRLEHIRELNEQLAIRDAEVAELKSWNGELVKHQDKLADKCDELRDQVTMLRSCLEAIVDPIAYMRSKLEDGQRLNGQMAIQLSESHSYLKGLANEALASDNEYLYVAAIERDQFKERLDLLIESSEMIAAELDELRLDSKRYGYLTRECRTRDFIIPASERKQSIDSAIDKALSATKHHDRS